jgi:hypothetical protein
MLHKPNLIKAQGQCQSSFCFAMSEWQLKILEIAISEKWQLKFHEIAICQNP